VNYLQNEERSSVTIRQYRREIMNFFATLDVSKLNKEAVKRGEAEIRLKGKTRTILLPKKLQRELTEYMRRERITAGPFLVTVRCERAEQKGK